MASDWSSHVVSQLVAVWWPAARLHGSFGHVPSDSSLQLTHLPYRHFLISLESDFWCRSKGGLYNLIEVLHGNLFRHFPVILLLNWTSYKLLYLTWTIQLRLCFLVVPRIKPTWLISAIGELNSQTDGIWLRFPCVFAAGRNFGTSCEIAWELQPCAIRLLSSACTPTI